MLWVHFYYYYYYFIGTWAEEEGKIDAIKFAFDVYDFKWDGTVDAPYADDPIRACRLNPSLKVGGQEEKRKKTLSKYKACKNLCGFNDFDEFLNLKMTTETCLEMRCSIPLLTLQ